MKEDAPGQGIASPESSKKRGRLSGTKEVCARFPQTCELLSLFYFSALSEDSDSQTKDQHEPGE